MLRVVITSANFTELHWTAVENVRDSWANAGGILDFCLLCLGHLGPGLPRATRDPFTTISGPCKTFRLNTLRCHVLANYTCGPAFPELY